MNARKLFIRGLVFLAVATATLIGLILVRETFHLAQRHGFVARELYELHKLLRHEKSTTESITGRPRGPIKNPEVYRFHNGLISVTDSGFNLDQNYLNNLSQSNLEILYEKVVLETTADCSTNQRFGRTVDGGWDLCLVGPFWPQSPCFSFSFGVNNIWEFDDQVAKVFKCQVVTFDPSMKQKRHNRSSHVQFLPEGLHSAKGKRGSWSLDSYLGFLKRFKADQLIIDILKVDIEFSEWPALETATKDGSLRNVKQLLIEMHINHKETSKNFLSYLAVLRDLHQLGFRQWHHNWNVNGNYKSKLNRDEHRTCCHELYYINKNFLNSSRTARNVDGSSLHSL